MMTDSRGDMHIGKIMVAIDDDNNIYHAMFHNNSPHHKEFFENQLQEAEAKENISKEWDIVSSDSSCQKLDDGMLELRVGSNANDQITFLIIPLNEEMRTVLRGG